MKFIKNSKLKVVILACVLIVIAFAVTIITKLFTSHTNDYYNEKNYNKRYSENYKEDFNMKREEGGMLKEKLKNFNIYIENRKYKSLISKQNDRYSLMLEDENSLVRKIDIPKNIENNRFSNENLDTYMNSCLPIMIHLSYNLYMDEAHKFLEQVSNDKKTVKTDYYIKDNNLLIIHKSEFYSEGKNLFTFESNGDISIKKYKGGR